MSNPYKTHLSKGPQPMTPEERNQIHLEVATGLMQENVWDISDPNMKRFRVMLQLYRDQGMEFDGEFNITHKGLGRRLIYQLHNDRRKKTTAYLSEKKYFDSFKKEE